MEKGNLENEDQELGNRNERYSKIRNGKITYCREAHL